MSAAVAALDCPRCGGPLVLHPGQRIARCPWCASLELVHTGPVVARFLAHPRVTRTETLSAIATELANPTLESGLVRRVRIAPPRLFFVPFYELQARRAGRARIDRERLQYASASESDGGGGLSSSPGSPSSRLSRVKRTEVDTKVVLSSWAFYWPAVELPAWGLGRIEAHTLRAGDAPALEGFNMIAANRTGTAFEPTVDPEAFRAAALKAAPSQSSDVKIIEERLSVLYYPVWRAAYQRGGRAFWISIDGITGRVIRLAGPPSRERAAVRVVALAAACGVLSGAFSHLGFALAGGPEPVTGLGGTGWPVSLALLTLALVSVRTLAHPVAALSDVVLVRRGTTLEPQ